MCKIFSLVLSKNQEKTETNKGTPQQYPAPSLTGVNVEKVHSAAISTQKSATVSMKRGLPVSSTMDTGSLRSQKIPSPRLKDLTRPMGVTD
jgi:hypothetical protein